MRRERVEETFAVISDVGEAIIGDFKGERNVEFWLPRRRESLSRLADEINDNEAVRQRLKKGVFSELEEKSLLRKGDWWFRLDYGFYEGKLGRFLSREKDKKFQVLVESSGFGEAPGELKLKITEVGWGTAIFGFWGETPIIDFIPDPTSPDKAGVRHAEVWKLRPKWRQVSLIDEAILLARSLAEAVDRDIRRERDQNET